MKEIIETLEKLPAYLSALFLLFASCTDMDNQKTDIPDATFRQIRLSPPTEAGTNLTNVNCYLFRNGIFYKRYHNLSVSGDGRTGLNIPADSELYFLANVTEPSQLTEMKEGATTRDEFLSYHTSATEEHSPTRAPSEFYSAKVNPDITDSSFDVSLGLSLSRIDVDASDASGVKIERIYTRSAAKTSSYFPSGSLSHATENSTYSFTFDPPETGKAEDVFRIYESDMPVTFIIEATYGDAPVTISTVIKEIKRNKIYKIRVQSDGMNVVSNILIDNWRTGSEIIASENEETGIRIDTGHSVLPSNITLDTSQTIANITSLGVTKMKLAFLTNEMLQLESVEGLPQAMGAPDISIRDGKYLTSYELALAPNSSLLTSCVTLNLKTTSDGQNVYGKITLNNHPFPYTIREVTMGKLLWMAFNCGASRSIYDQIYPELYGFSETKDMYEKEWLQSLGSMVRWTDASASCPEGYRLPTHTEFRNILAGGINGGGVIPGSWLYESDEISANILGSGGVSNNGANPVPRYLEIKNRFGAIVYFPFGGVKETASMSPDLGESLCLWSSESTGTHTAYAYKLTYTNEPHLSPDYELELDKENYAYVRCVKDI